MKTQNHVLSCLRAGVDIVTIPESLFFQMFKHPLTDVALAQFAEDWKKIVENWKKKGFVCHLTMYGINIEDCLTRIPKNKDVLIVVGSQKVPKEIFKLSNLNIAIGNQPHSEVAALAIFLDRLFKGHGVKTDYKGSKMKVVPQERSKIVI